MRRFVGERLGLAAEVPDLHLGGFACSQAGFANDLERFLPDGGPRRVDFGSRQKPRDSRRDGLRRPQSRDEPATKGSG